MFHCHNNESLVFKQIMYMKNTKNFTTFSIVTTLLFSRHVKGLIYDSTGQIFTFHLFFLYHIYLLFTNISSILLHLEAN